MNNIRISRVAAIAAKCRDCIHDPRAAGSWRAQVAACVSANCALHSVRPIPRSCLKDGRIDPAAIAALRERLDETDRVRSV